MVNYSAIILASEPSSYWRLGDSGATAVDLRGPNNGTYQGSMALATGLIAADPNQGHTATSTQYVAVPDNPSLAWNDLFSFELWIKRGNTGVASVLFSKGNGPPSIEMTSGNALKLRRPGTGDVVTSTVTIAETTTAHHFVVTKNGSAVKLYLDGVDVTGAVSNQTMSTNSTQLCIGADSGGSNPFSGVIDEVAIYNSVMSLATAQAHYRAGNSATVIVA